MRRLLIVGCGDVGARVLALVAAQRRVLAMVRSPERRHLVRTLGGIPVGGDLDRPESLTRLAGLAEDVVHMAPPPQHGERDTRTRHLIHALSARARLPQRLVYMSTTGVYGDCGGDWVDETRTTRPESSRAVRRVDAERQLREWGRATGVRVMILRVPGIYADDRLPLDRLRAGAPVLEAGADPFTNHVHADDLARIVVAALERGRAGRVYHATDDSCLRMGEYFDRVAARFGLPAPPRVPWSEAEQRLSPMTLSFMRESRRLRNGRLKRELRFTFRHPTVDHALAALPAHMS